MNKLRTWLSPTYLVNWLMRTIDSSLFAVKIVVLRVSSPLTEANCQLKADPKMESFDLLLMYTRAFYYISRHIILAYTV